MTLSADERSRFLASLREDLEFRDQVRREVLTAELLELPERFAAFVDEVHAFVDEVHAFVDEVHAFVEATNRRLEALEHGVGRLQDDSAKLRGMTLEHKIQRNPGYYLRQHARKVKVVDLDDLLDQAGIDDLSDVEYATLGRTDLLARGVPPESGVPTVIVVEATWRAHTRDVDRLVVRRQILANRQVPAIALIAAAEPPSEDMARYAAMNGVLVSFGGVDEDVD